MATAMTDGKPIYSSFGSDSDMGELVQMFVEEMPDRIAVFERASAQGDKEWLRRAAHQMKDAAGNFGFDQLTPLAVAVEDAIRANDPEEQVLNSLRELIGLCRQVRSGQPE
jgi:HPt (histidine-containing phosphotransfer) domain-containing protein